MQGKLTPEASFLQTPQIVKQATIVWFQNTLFYPNTQFRVRCKLNYILACNVGIRR